MKSSISSVKTGPLREVEMVTGTTQEKTSAAARSFVIWANQFSRKGHHAAAETLYQRALVLAERTLGPLHPVTAEVLECYADLLARTARLSEATAMKHRAEAIWKAYAPRACRSYKDAQPCSLCTPYQEGSD
jgi:hypothetical protein